MNTTLTPQGYSHRLMEAEVTELLATFGAVEIDGVKWCGKTWLSLNHAQSAIRLDDNEIREMVISDPTLALQGSQPHLIDEWQEAPQVRDEVRRFIDNSGSKPGSFILTGSSTPVGDSVRHSGTGRIAFVHLRPFSLYEAGLSDGLISLHALFNGIFTSRAVDIRLETLAEEICRGGWPAARNLPLDKALRVPAQYMKSIYDFSAPRMGKSSDIARRVFRSLARTTGEQASYATLVSDIAEGEEADSKKNVSRYTVEEYLEFYKRLYLVEDLLGWDAPVRARTRVRSRPKRYLVDPSLATATLGLSPQRLMKDMQTFGRLFEVLCIRDLKIYLSSHTETSEAQIRYYRDDYGLEVDVIIELPDGRWGGIEIKLSEDKVSEGVSNLIRLKNKVMENHAAQPIPPSFLAVLVGRTSFARKTPEGIYVIPVSALTV